MKESDNIMYTFNENISKEEYDTFIKNYSMAPFYQEYNWANVKKEWNSLHVGLYKNQKLVGIALILIKKLFRKTNIFYIPRGFLIDFENMDDLKAMTDNIKKLAKKYHAYEVKIDPNFCISDDSLKDIECEHNYSNNYKIKHNNLIKLGYKWTGLNKEIGKNLQPQYNMFAPMCDTNSNILTPEEVLATYKSKFRYYMGDFHKKRGICFEITNDINRLDDFLKMIKDTEKKQNINLRNKDYFENLMNNYINNAYLVFGKIDLNIYLDYLKNNNGKETDIEEVNNLLKEMGNELILSAALIIMPCNDVGIRTSEYLYAGNSSYLTNLCASQGVVFEIIKFSIDKNCQYCNLGGVDGNLNDHLSTFKRKFNARLMVFTGEYDLPVSKKYYPIKLFYPLLIKVYRKMHKKKTED